MEIEPRDLRVRWLKKLTLEDALTGVPKLSNISCSEFQLHSMVLLEFGEFAIEWFTFQKFHNLQISRTTNPSFENFTFYFEMESILSN